MPGHDCIAALVTGGGAAGVCIVRVSGPGALQLGAKLLPPEALPLEQRRPGTFFHTRIVDPSDGSRLDDALVLVFHAPHSFTGEDTFEIQGHGGQIQARLLLNAVLAAGARAAEPGEFSRRAFLNGRLDLTRAEALCDLIQAQSTRAAKVAHAQLDGTLGRKIDSLYEEICALRAEVEHLLDFIEGELPDGFFKAASTDLNRWLADLKRLALTWREGHLVRHGALVVICGRPNAGKSSLLNALLGHDRAIVHAQPGTTRDTLEEVCLVDGIPLRLVDTAGLRQTPDAVEQVGIDRARNLMARADLILYLIDRSRPLEAECLHEQKSLPAAPRLTVLTKCDLPGALGQQVEGLELSALQGFGLDELKSAMIECLGAGIEQQTEPLITSLRQKVELEQALEQGDSAARLLLEGPEQLVLAAGHLRLAAEALGRITGKIYSEDLLDRIFSRFCVGK